MEIDWDANLYSEALGCVTLDKLLDLSEPLFLHMHKRNNKHPHPRQAAMRMK